MSLAVSVNFPAPFCRGRLLHVDEDATLLSVLWVALGDNKSLHGLHFNSRDLTKQEKTGAVSFKVSHHRRKRSSGARAEKARDGGLELVTNARGQPSNTHARPGRLWKQCSSGSEATGRPTRYQSYCSLLLKSRGWHTGFACKKFSAKKKPTARP